MLAALWWGGITALSFLAVPTLFAQLGNPAVAGPVAAKLFSLQCYAGLLLGLALLVSLRRGTERGGAPDGAAMTTLGIVLLGMILALLQEFGVAQNIVTARASGGNLRLWHGVGTAMVLGQWLCAGTVLWRLSRSVPTR
ncbi:DUF4149 domain-containing protein [Hydrogenophaga laconesensis]|uniref:TMEM205-like domain-containing protein n=1 Tax=Hydrogenophaga laconesensis TaxID=1805971 RepID=A0ABU1V4U8_9BURK|nr:DUF4149 domain-containing protein [Hydrogenophaga laconesensis]MDR7092486.1 hypothetical protein [Hydrogenophaga laconesensis]